MSSIKDIIKALLISSEGKMLNMEDFTKAMPDIPRASIHQMLDELVDEGGDVYDVVEIQGNYFARTRKEFVPYIKKTKEVKTDIRQRRALIETLAVIAMRQPVSRNDIEDARCCQLNITVLHDLQECGWIEVVKIDAHGMHLYGTTLKFLQDFGLTSIQEIEALSNLSGILV